MTRSSPLSSADPLLRRACAGEWPYEPDEVEHARHPSLSARTEITYKVFVVPNDASQRHEIGVEVARRSARLMLKGRNVRHFEIVSNAVDGTISVPHEECQEEGCDDCNGIGALLIPHKEGRVHIMGWLAVVRN